MAVTMADITKLRKMTGAGMMDCKNALTEAEGDFDKAVKIIREKGQAVAAKRSDREASEGCVLVKAVDGFGAMIALKCETDFVAQNADFIKLTQDILDAAIANKCKTLDEVIALPLGDVTVAQAVVDRSGITGEKMELDGYMTASYTDFYGRVYECSYTYLIVEGKTYIYVYGTNINAYFTVSGEGGDMTFTETEAPELPDEGGEDAGSSEGSQDEGTDKTV